jgi:D-alanyl-D-alanine carboxypeptidase
LRRRKSPNYFLRRLLVTLVTTGVVGGAAWFIYDRTDIFRQTEPEVSAPARPETPSEPAEESPVPEESPEPEEAPAGNPDDSWRLMLVSPVNPVGTEYEPPELEYVSGDYAVDSRIAPALKRMIADAKLEGVNLMICSAYRTAQYQSELHNRQIDYYKSIGQSDVEAVATASTIVVPPGTSEHQTGLAVDIVEPEYQTLDDGFADTLAAKWLYENSWKYGFILRYPQDKTEITKVIFEPWHYRFVGEENARIIREGELCLEEYLWQNNSAFAGLSRQSEPKEESLPGAETSHAPESSAEPEQTGG